MTIGFASSPRFVDHITGPHHPERPDRIRTIYRALDLSHLLPVTALNPFPEFRSDLGPLPAFDTPMTELHFGMADERWIETIHPRAYIDRVRHVSNVCGVLDQGDTPTSADSFDVAKLAVGATLACCDAVVNGTVSRAFAAVRPPGHHAEPARPMGFCLFANVSIAARYLQQKHGVGKVAIVDFDVHHGNGTQACFYADPSVYYVSLHQDPRTCYPGTGYEDETGLMDGRGTTLNIAFNPGAGDKEYLQAVERRVLPELFDFAPEVLLISAGFDAHRDDPLAHIELSEEGFARMTSLLMQVAERSCWGRVVSVLEGGYNLRALGRSVVRHIGAMME